MNGKHLTYGMAVKFFVILMKEYRGKTFNTMQAQDTLAKYGMKIAEHKIRRIMGSFEKEGLIRSRMINKVRWWTIVLP